MEDETTPNEPLNPYARIFFGLWGLIAILLVCFRADGPTYGEQTDGQHRLDVKTSWQSEVDAESNQVIDTPINKRPAQRFAFTFLADGSLPLTHDQLSLAVRTGVK